MKMWWWIFVGSVISSAIGWPTGVNNENEEQAHNDRTKSIVVEKLNKSTKYEESKVGNVLKNLDPDLLNIMSLELHKILVASKLIDVENKSLYTSVNETEQSKKENSAGLKESAKPFVGDNSMHQNVKENEDIFTNDLRYQNFNPGSLKQLTGILGLNGRLKNNNLTDYKDAINKSFGQNVKVEDGNDKLHISVPKDKRLSFVLKYVPKKEETILRNNVEQDSLRYSRIFKPMRLRNTYYTMRSKPNQFDSNLGFDRKKRAVTDADYSRDAPCKKYNDNLDIMWKSLAKIIANGQSLTNKEHLHNIAKLIKAYLDQENVPQIGNSLDNQNIDKSYETIVKPLLLDIIKLLKRSAPPINLLDEILLSLRPFILNPDNQACRNENLQLLTKSFDSVYQEYETDTKSCHYHIKQPKLYSFGSQSSVEIKPLNLGKVFGRGGSENIEENDKDLLLTSYETQNQEENENLRIKDVYDVLRNYGINNDTDLDHTNSDHASDLDIRDMTQKTSTLLTKLQTDRTKRSADYLQRETDDNFLQYCKSYVLKRFLDSITSIVQRYIENADCTYHKIIQSNVQFSTDRNRNKENVKDHSDTIKEISKNINDLLALVKYSPNDEQKKIPPFKTDNEYLTDRIKNMEKLLQPKNGLNRPDKIPGILNNQTLLNIKAANKDKNKLSPDLIKLVDAIYKPDDGAPFRYPKGSLVPSVDHKNYIPFIKQQSTGLKQKDNFDKAPYGGNLQNLHKKYDGSAMNDNLQFEEFMSNYEKLTNSSNLNQNNISNINSNIPNQQTKSSNSFNYQFKKKSKNTMENEENFSQSELHTLFTRILDEEFPEKQAKRSQTPEAYKFNSGITPTPESNPDLFASEFNRLRDSQLLDVLSKLSAIPTIELPTTTDGDLDEKNVEMTYVVRQPQVFLYQPQVIVKQRLKNEQFLKNINNILNSKTISSKNRVQLQKVVKLNDNKDFVLYETTHAKSPLAIMDADTLEEKLNGENCKHNKIKNTDKENESTMFTYSFRKGNPFDAKNLVELSNPNATTAENETKVNASRTLEDELHDITKVKASYGDNSEKSLTENGASENPLVLETATETENDYSRSAKWDEYPIQSPQHYEAKVKGSRKDFKQSSNTPQFTNLAQAFSETQGSHQGSDETRT